MIINIQLTESEREAYEEIIITLRPKKASVPTHNILDIIELKLQHVFRLNTRRNYESLLRFIDKHCTSDIKEAEVNQDVVTGFLSTLNCIYTKGEVMRATHISTLKSVINFGKKSGLIPLTRLFDFPKDRPRTSVNRNFELSIIAQIWKLAEVMTEKDILLSNLSTQSLAIFCLMIAFQGLAPVDMANLKVGDLEFITISCGEAEIEAIRINTCRIKSNMPVCIVVPIHEIKHLISPYIKNKSLSDYVFGCYEYGKSYSDKQRQNRLSNYFNKCAKELNKEVSEYLLSNGIELTNRITYYCARHAYCDLADSMDVPRYLIQQLVGHRTSILESSYIRPLSTLEQLRISQSIFKKLKELMAEK